MAASTARLISSSTGGRDSGTKVTEWARTAGRSGAGRPAVAIAHGDDRHTGSEMAQRMAEFVRRDHPLFVAGTWRECKVPRIDSGNARAITLKAFGAPV